MSVRRQDIINAVKTRLQGITVANSYHSNLGMHVFNWRTSAIDASLLPCVIVRDANNILELEESTTLGFHVQKLEVEFEIICASGATGDTAIREMIADIYRAVGVDEQWSQNALASAPVSDEILIDQQDKTITGAIVKIQILWRTGRWKEN